MRVRKQAKFLTYVALAALLMAVLASASAESSRIPTSSINPMLLFNNSRIKQAAISERKAEILVLQAQVAANRMESTLKMFHKYNIGIDAHDEFQMVLGRDFGPLQAKYGHEMASSAKKVTTNALTIAAREMYSGLFMLGKDLEVKSELYELAKEQFKHNQLRYEQGLISSLEFEEATYDEALAEKNYHQADREYQNMLRSFRAFLGIKRNVEFDLAAEELNDSELKPLPNYIEEALSNRLEVLDLKGQLELMEEQFAIYEQKKGNITHVTFLTHPQIKQDYENLKKQYEIAKMSLSKIKLDIEQEITAAYNDIITTKKQVLALQKTYDLQKRRLEQYRLQEEVGNISAPLLDQLVSQVKSLATNLDMLVYTYNTKRFKLDNAVDVGPAY